MKFLCLAYEEEAVRNGLSRAEWDGLRAETLAYVEILPKSGHLILTHALQSERLASTVRMRGGADRSWTDPMRRRGSSSGDFLIEARDRDEAVELASRWPSARLGSIEVRPIEERLRDERRY